jgi:RNA polymerase sigma-70 factor (ECF subfamily)
VKRAETVGDRFVEQAVPYAKVLYTRAQVLTPTRFDAEDLLQETLMKAYVSFDTFQQGTNLRAWLYRIMYNTWINHYRARQRRPAELLTDAITDRHFHHCARHASQGLRSAEVEVLENLRDDEIATGLNELSEEFRVAVFLADVEGYSYREIAGMMEIPVGTVMSRLHRGRRVLRQLLAGIARQRGVIRDDSSTDPRPGSAACQHLSEPRAAVAGEPILATRR